MVLLACKENQDKHTKDKTEQTKPMDVEQSPAEAKDALEKWMAKRPPADIDDIDAWTQWTEAKPIKKARSG